VSIPSDLPLHGRKETLGLYDLLHSTGALKHDAVDFLFPEPRGG